MATVERRPGDLLIEALRFCGLDDWHHLGDLLIEVLRFCGLVALAGGVLLALLGVLSGSPEPHETRFNLDLFEQGFKYAVIGAALYAGSWALRRLLGRT
jgi:hypothetical protein